MILKLLLSCWNNLWFHCGQKARNRISQQTNLNIIVGVWEGDSSQNETRVGLLEPNITAWLYDNKQTFDPKLETSPVFLVRTEVDNMHVQNKHSWTPEAKQTVNIGKHFYLIPKENQKSYNTNLQWLVAAVSQTSKLWWLLKILVFITTSKRCWNQGDYVFSFFEHSEIIGDLHGDIWPHVWR